VRRKRAASKVVHVDVQVVAYTNGRSMVTPLDTLMLRHILWSRPEDGDRIYDWLLSRIASGGTDVQSNYLLSSLFGRTCHALQVCLVTSEI
jgi:hypothetical protein